MFRRPVIAPGLHVLTAPSGVVQVGLAPPHRLRVPDTPGVRRALALLGRGEALPETRDVQRARTLLEPALREGDALHRPGIAAADLAAVTLAHPRSGADRLAARSRARLEVAGELGPDLGALLEAVGLTRRAAGSGPPTVALLISRGEPDREALDTLVRAEVPHLVVRAVESEIVLGPFVVPGRTACLRCCDLHAEDREVGYGALLRASVLARRTDGVPEPVDTARAWVALGWAVGDLVRHVEGDRPSTWSSTVTLDESGVPSTRRWTPHPRCSCTWIALDPPLDASATMGS